MKCCGVVGTMAGSLPGMLLRIQHKCMRFVNFKTHFCVGLGAFMMGGVSVIHGIGLVGGIVTLYLLGEPTLCSSHCCGGVTYGDNCTSPWGSIYAWVGAVKVCAINTGVSVSNRLNTRDKIGARLFDGSSLKVMASSSMTSCNFLFHSRNGT